ncbi:zinc-ribbon domain-containing protein, partial [Escherichia coli]|uniref:zinc-ribbon domain-containing protein n=1 Tax=Escherichia coli TaxID=562 RepID=UPI001F5A4767
MNGIKTGLGITPGEHIISADSALSRNIRQCFCLSCHGRLILQTDAQGAWFEHDLYALSEQQKAACVVLNPEKSHPYIEDMEMFLSPLLSTTDEKWFFRNLGGRKWMKLSGE